jgi:ubiquinone/menaquinone biosynthesis C-methylase UbiE
MDSKEQRRIVKDGYDCIARLYHLDRISDKWGKTEKELSEFIGLLPKGGRVLDAGCGAGVPVLETLTKGEFKVVGVDFSLVMLMLSQWHVLGVDLVQVDLTQPGFRKESFHGIVSTYTIIHIPKEYHHKVYTYMFELLKPPRTNTGEHRNQFMGGSRRLVWCTDVVESL